MSAVFSSTSFFAAGQDQEIRLDQVEVRLMTDSWHGVMCDEICVESPTAAAVTQAIEALDAVTRTALTLHRGSASISVGGGRGLYVIFVALGDEEQFWNLLSESAETGVIMINIGGQEGDHPARQVVDREKAVRAALCFLESGRRDPALTWELQD